jgi:hypothetical protein
MNTFAAAEPVLLGSAFASSSTSALSQSASAPQSARRKRRVTFATDVIAGAGAASSDGLGSLGDELEVCLADIVSPGLTELPGWMVKDAGGKLLPWCFSIEFNAGQLFATLTFGDVTIGMAQNGQERRQRRVRRDDGASSRHEAAFSGAAGRRAGAGAARTHGQTLAPDDALCNGTKLIIDEIVSPVLLRVRALNPNTGDA